MTDDFNFADTDIVIGLEEGEEPHRPIITHDSINPDGIRVVLVENVVGVIYNHFCKTIDMDYCYANKASEVKSLLTLFELLDKYNAPVKATKEVLAGMPSDANFVSYKVGYAPMWQAGYWCNESNSWWDEACKLDATYVVKSDGCAKTLKWLLNFNTKGIERKTQCLNINPLPY